MVHKKQPKFFLLSLLVIVWAAFFAFPVSCLAADLIAVTENLPPYNYQDENNQPSGFSTQVLQAMLDRAGLEALIHFFPWPRAYRMALVKPNVLIYTMVRNQEREQLFHWIGPIATFEFSLYALKDRTDIQLDAMKEASIYRISVLRDSMNKQKLLSSGVDPSAVHEVANEQLNLIKLFRGNTDIITGTDLVISHLAKETGHSFADITKVYASDDVNELYFALSKASSPALAEKLRNAFASVKEDGTLDYIMGMHLTLNKE